MSNQPSSDIPSPLLALDTTAGSFLHQLTGYANRPALGHVLPLSTIYISAAAVTLIPLTIAALLGPLSLTVITATHRLPFLYDWNVLFMFLISFPSLVVLIANDQQVLCSSLNEVVINGTLTINEANANRLCTRWRNRFRSVNHTGQLLGLVVGGVVAYFSYIAYTPASVGFWTAENDHLLPAGFIFLYCMFVFYSLIPIFILRSIAIAFLLKDIVEHATLRMVPLHPDKSGGLRPMGNLGLRNQYLLTIFGLNIVILVAISFHYLQVPSTLFGLIAVAILAYLILGPVVFMAPLLSFREGMLKTKADLMAEVAQRLRVELQRLSEQLKSGEITRKDEELIDRLRKIGSVIDELPVWPFDAATLRKFFAAYVIPVMGSISIPIAKIIFDIAKDYLPR